ncbi:hypothetical protein KSD_50000 [Ktedonobacter sp. SOSP1-85]|uniref:hypothetical protein n=1 Tax=Ktedonobacter sp. SOSP1-85 TaxID=2778367 RepID=UPI001A207AF5|nr:hypothetical protein [Ktedonobacter sp. SOSP1-85]GHO77229.1 hypothetical protein KSD_50000 [Ktedonobacter sp. SOSP1-85]
MGKRPGLLYEALQRFDSLMALGQSRADAKAQAHARGERFWSFSDGKMHSYQTRATYQDMVMRFLRWCRATYGTKRLADVDQRAGRLQPLDPGHRAQRLTALLRVPTPG